MTTEDMKSTTAAAHDDGVGAADTDKKTGGDGGGEPRPLWKKILTDWVMPLVIAMAILTPVRASIIDWNDVPSGSMKPTILVGDRIFVNKLAYGLRVPLTKVWVNRWNEPERGEIVICHNPNDGIRLVKRVVAVAGDTLSMHRGKLLIDGVESKYTDPDMDIVGQMRESDIVGHEFVTEWFGQTSHQVMRTPGVRSIRDKAPIVVPEGHIFVMGDNRDLSLDSRVFGFISLDQVVGRAGAVVASVDTKNYFMPRWGRFFSKLR